MKNNINKMGIYLVQPKGKLLKIIYNRNDADKVKDQSKILKVNEENIKFGQSNDLDKRHREFKEIFGQDVYFKNIIIFNDNKILINFKKNLKKIFRKFCLKSLSNRRQMEWMENITFKEAENIILKEYDNG